MGQELADGDDVVVACFTVIDNARVIEDAASESAGRVADIAVFNGRHVVVCLAGGIGSVVAGVATDGSHYLAAMVYERTGKGFRVMARTAVGAARRVVDCLAGSRDSVVAGGAGLGNGIEDRVVESTTHVKCADAMAGHAIHACRGMVRRLSARIGAVVAADTGDRYVAMVYIGRQEGGCRVTVAALGFSGDVPCVHARGCGAVVASSARAGTGAVVEAAAGQAIKKVIRIVAFIARLGRRYMKLRFSYGKHTVVALAADAKDFMVID